MKHIEKIVTKYKGAGSFDAFFDAVRNADEDDLKVLLGAILLEEKNGEAVNVSELCDLLGIDDEGGAVSASIKYWKGAGLVGLPKKSTAKNPQSIDAQKKTEIDTEKKSAHRDGKLERDSMPSYTTAELTQLMEKRQITAKFIDEASRVFGKIFNQHEVECIVHMIDYIGFDEECVLLLLSYYKNRKKTLRYVEKAALALYDEGISDAEALSQKLFVMEKREEAEGKIRSMFGMGGRELTTKEKKYIVAWVEKMHFDVEMIRLAYDRTVDATHGPSVPYANGILERWFADGINTPEKVKEAEEKRAAANAKSKENDVTSSFDTDDFFEAALRRSYSDLD